MFKKTYLVAHLRKIAKIRFQFNRRFLLLLLQVQFGRRLLLQITLGFLYVGVLLIVADSRLQTVA